MAGRRAVYLPAAGHRWLTPLYDPVQRWLLREATLKRRLVDAAGIAPGHRVLDLGCGTGTLAVLVARRQPAARLLGLDVDPDILRRARAKVTRAGGQIQLVGGRAERPPCPSAAFDRVLASLVLHHLPPGPKQAALAEVARVLRPGGALYVLDFAPPHDLPSYAVSLGMRWLEAIGDHVRGRLPAWLEAAGLAPVEEVARYRTLFGAIAIWAAWKPQRLA